ncbi:uncharacterized protein LOC126742844 [Anthonomus grandis grandis]|uniref:uncharacterized protein LOC126742844 n=1 Tax=Anthonomus grandis grandis TaxID=2921223 RepID=UPI0021658914|nr:uncharacterized protein LOC126742844 [Anthonomus grandis grandis]
MDNSITHYETHSYEPYLPTKLGNNDEIVIPVNEVEKYTLPGESSLYIEGKLTKSDGTVSKKASFINNGVAFLFKEMRYQLNGVTIDSVRDVGMTSTLKGYLSYNNNEVNKLENAGWYLPTTTTTTTTTTEKKSIVDEKTGFFNVSIPLKTLMGFFEDYKKVIINSKQELILVRDHTDNNAVTTTEANESLKVTLSKVSWNVPHISVGISQELLLTKIIDKNVDIEVGFRCWELIEYPELLKTNRHNWPVKTSTKIETPRHVIIAFQSGKRDQLKEDMSKFHDINLRSIRVFLNSERYPYIDLNLDIKQNKFATLYEMYSQFQSTYYSKTDEPMFNPEQFKTIAPISYINCIHQKELLQSGPVVMRVEFELNSDLDKDTSAYCLVIYDRVFTYNPLTKIVRQI